MATEFHFFPLLPWELRDQIWNLAVRPALPGAHVFRVLDAKDKDPKDPAHETTSSGYDRSWKPRLAAPQCLSPGTVFSPAAQAVAPISWTLNNPSTYLIDSGLWTACKESQLAIDKAFRIRAGRSEEVWSQSHSDTFRERAGRFTLPETATFAARHHDAGRRYLTVFHDQDLVILQSDDVVALDWKVVWNSFPQYDFNRRWYQRDDAYSDRNIAVEYNPAWDRPAPNLTRDIVESTALVDGGRYTLWFIDYRIKRNPKYPATALADKDQKVFYASDRRYVEVKGDELGREAGHDLLWDAGNEDSAEDLRKYHRRQWLRRDDTVDCGASAFVVQLNSDRDDDWDLEQTDTEDREIDYTWVNYGLLACEYL